MTERRKVLQLGAGLLGLTAAGAAANAWAQRSRPAAPSQDDSAAKPAPRAAVARRAGRVVVIGAGWGGTTAAKYIRLWSSGTVEVALVDPQEKFISAPVSNLVLSGARTLDQLTFAYAGLEKLGVRVIHDHAVDIDHARKRVRLQQGDELDYDRVIVAPGLDLMFEKIAGYDAQARRRVLHAWKAGPELSALRRQLESMPDGGVFVISIPMAPYRCPPAPYERACQVALYFKRNKPRSKVLILDANEDIASMRTLFSTAFKKFYGGIIDYQPNNEVNELDLKGMALKTDFDTFKGDVLNVLPPMQAAGIAHRAGLVTANNRWCGVNWLTMESIAQKDVHVLGDATLSANLMPKSGHMANQHGKIAAAAVTASLLGKEPSKRIVVANACYSYTSDRHVIHTVSVHRYDPAKKDLLPVRGAGGLSRENSEKEYPYAEAWARSIWADMLT